MPNPAIAESRCSIVMTRVEPSTRAVQRLVSPTFSALAWISTGWSKSTRRKTIPVSTAAGRKVM